MIGWRVRARFRYSPTENPTPHKTGRLGPSGQAQTGGLVVIAEVIYRFRHHPHKIGRGPRRHFTPRSEDESPFVLLPLFYGDAAAFINLFRGAQLEKCRFHISQKDVGAPIFA